MAAVTIPLGVVAWLLVRVGAMRQGPTARHDSRALLDERLARGELSLEEYEAHRKALR